MIKTILKNKKLIFRLCLAYYYPPTLCSLAIDGIKLYLKI